MNNQEPIVFISHSTQDDWFVANLRHGIEERTNYTVWTDDIDIKGGTDWLDSIDKAIKNSFAFINVISPDALNSKYVETEREIALSLKIKIIPIAFRKDDLTLAQNAPDVLPSLQWLHFLHPNTADWNGLIEVLNTARDAYSQQVNSDVEKLLTQLAELKLLQSRQDELDKMINDLRAESSGIITERKALAAEGKKMNERIARLEKAEGALCPLCGHPLDDEHRQRTLDDLNTERDDKRQMYAAATERVNEIKSEISYLVDEAIEISERLLQVPKIEKKLFSLGINDISDIEGF